MDDDDEFGDLYTDVLVPLSAPIQSRFNPQPQPPTGPSQGKQIANAANSLQGRPVDVGLSSDDDDGNENVLGALNSNSTAHLTSRHGSDFRPGHGGFDLNHDAGQEARNSDGLSLVKLNLKDRVLENKNEVVRLEEKGFDTSSFMDEADIDVVVEERHDKADEFLVKDENSGEKDEKFKIIIAGNVSAPNVGVGQGESKTGVFLSDQIIPGISVGGVSGGAESYGNASLENDSDSDSEDDLQIVLNDNFHGPMEMDNVGGGGLMGVEEDDDEDGDPLVIVADNDDPNNRLMIGEDPEWRGEEVGIGGDGEKKEHGDVSKVSGTGGSSMVPKTGYSNHVYHHPFPSQFKYVRPGAAPMTGAASSAVGTPGQVRPPGGMVPVVGRGRGFHGEYGAPVWGVGGAGRGYGIGLEFTLPSHKTIFEVDIDIFEEKPWRLPGIDIADFFNFGLNEESWKDYCKQLEQFRFEKTMQSKIRVYESVRTGQDYDPDLPPELAAASGIQDTPEIAKQGITDDGQIDLTKSGARVKPPLPMGRAIPVETGCGERIPTVDMRKPRISDLDAIIVIICQDSADDDDDHDSRGDDMADHQANDWPMQDRMDHNEFEVIRQDDNLNAGNRKMVIPERRSPGDDMSLRDTSLHLSLEARPVDSTDSRERSPVHRGRRDMVRIGRTRSPTPLCTKDKSSGEHQKDESMDDGNRSVVSLSRGNNADKSSDDEHESLDDGNHSVVSLSRGNNADVPIEHIDSLSDEIVQVDEKEESLTDKREYVDNSKHVSNNQKLSLPVEIDNGEEVEEEARSISGNSARISYEKFDSRDEIRMRRVHDERHDLDRNPNAIRGRDEVYPHHDRDPYSDSQFLAKHERDGRKEIDDNSENIRRHLHQRDEEIHRRRSRSRHNRCKVHEIDSEKDERQIRKQQLENKAGGWRSSYDRDMASSKYRDRDRDDHFKNNRNDNMDDILHSKRRKEETYIRREHTDREETRHAHRETGTHRKRERDDVYDVRKRNDDQQNNIIRIKDDGLFHRERGQRDREEWHHRVNKPKEQQMSSRKDDGEMNGVMMRGGSRVSEENNAWASQPGGRHKELLPKRRDRVENGVPHDDPPHARGGTQHGNNSERRARHERVSARDDHASGDSRLHEKKHKQNPRHGKESEVVDRDKNNGQISDTVRVKNRGVMGSDENKHNIIVYKRSRDDVSSGDEEQQDSKRGRSKLERWTSNKERDFSVVIKQTKDVDSYVVATVTSSTSKKDEHPPPPLLFNNEGGGDLKPVVVQDSIHLDTVEKLKKRSERFKLPMPVERETTSVKKMETEHAMTQIQIPSSSSPVQTENHGDSEVKAERPARKRRWTSSS